MHLYLNAYSTTHSTVSYPLCARSYYACHETKGSAPPLPIVTAEIRLSLTVKTDRAALMMRFTVNGWYDAW